MQCDGSGKLKVFVQDPEDQTKMLPIFLDCQGCKACGYVMPEGTPTIGDVISAIMDGKKTYTGVAMTVAGLLAAQGQGVDLDKETIRQGIEHLTASWAFLLQIAGVVVTLYGRFKTKK